MTSSTHWTLAFMPRRVSAAPGASPPKRGKGDSSAGSICNFLASTRAATVSSSALCRELDRRA
jgi:hypothetical protein